MRESRKKEKLTPKQRTIDQLEFQIVPVSVSFSNSKTNELFYLYIEKGAQVLGKVDEAISTRGGTFMFSKPHSKPFRVSNDKNLTYQWSIYRYTPESNEEEYLESVQFGMKEKYIEYLYDLEKREVDLYRIYLEKEKKSEIEEIWKDLRYDLTHNNVEMECKFLRMNVTVVFRLVIKCDLDFRLEKFEEIKEVRRLARTIHSTTRKESIDSKFKMSEQSFYESKEKVVEMDNNSSQKTTLQLHKVPIVVGKLEENQSKMSNNEKSRKSSGNEEEEIDEDNIIYESEIRITNPEGLDVTEYSSQNDSDTQPPNQNNSLSQSSKNTDLADYYYRKKSSMLSDIIEESYEGSSNVFTKSNQGEKLKSMDEIHEEDEPTPMFSPLIKTQNYDHLKFEGDFEKFKRTTTFVHKGSDDFEIEESPKNTIKSKLNHYFPSVLPRNQHPKSELTPEKHRLSEKSHSLSPNEAESPRSRKSSFTEEEENENVKDLFEEKKTTIMNLTKISVILILLVIIIYNLGLFDEDTDGKSIKINEKRKSSNNNKVNAKPETVIKKDQPKKIKNVD